MGAVEVALVVVVGRSQQRAPEPGQGEDRAPAAGRHDRAAAVQRQVGVVQGDVRPAAGPDARHLGLVVQLAGAQAVGPDARRVDDVRGVHDELVAAERVADLHARRPAGVVAYELADVQPVGADRAEALGLAEDGQHEPHVVGLAVVEQVAGRGLAGGQRRDELEHLLAGDHAVALRAPGGEVVAELGRGGVAPAARARARAGAAAALDRHDVVEVQADADLAFWPRAVEGGDDERQRMDDVRRERDHQLALEQRLADEPEVEVLQVAQAAVDELGGAARRAGGEVRALDEGHAVATRGGVQRHAGARDPAADDDDVELLLGESGEGVAAVDHPS